MASLGQKALKRAFQKSGGNWDLACEILMAEAHRTNVNGIMLEVFQYYVRHEADFLYEIDEENVA
jgi:hypothetical protein